MMRRSRALAIAIALVGAVTAAPRAQPVTALDAGDPGPTPAELGFRAATRLSAEGRPAEAALAIEALLATLPPDDPVADDALFELARLREEELGDPAGARAAYGRLIAEHPGARLARRAESRAEALAHALGPDDRHAATAAAVARATRRPPGESLDAAGELARLLDAAPDYPAAAEVARWIAGAYRRADYFPEARRWFTRAREASVAAGDLEGEREARRALAELAMALGDLDTARSGIHALLDGASEGDRMGLESTLGRIAVLEARRARARWAWVVLAALVALAAGTLRRAAGTWPAAARALWPPPSEVLYLAPVAVLLGVLAMTGNVLISRAVITLLAAGLVITWVSGALLDAARRTGPLRLPRVLAHAAAASVAVAAVCVLALSRDALLDLVVATFRHGAER